MFTILSIPCGIATFILYYWNKNNTFNSILYSLPVGALLAETIATTIYLLQYNKFLFQILMDAIGVIILGYLIFSKTKSKKTYIIFVGISALIFYFIFYHRSLF